MRTTSFAKEARKEHFGVGQFCGDGSLYVALSSGDFSLVFEAESGDLVREIGYAYCGWPLHGPFTCKATTARGSWELRATNLESGEETSFDLRELP